KSRSYGFLGNVWEKRGSSVDYSFSPMDSAAALDGVVAWLLALAEVSQALAERGDIDLAGAGRVRGLSSVVGDVQSRAIGVEVAGTQTPDLARSCALEHLDNQASSARLARPGGAKQLSVELARFVEPGLYLAAARLADFDPGQPRDRHTATGSAMVHFYELRVGVSPSALARSASPSGSAR
ncbi:MAG TPA: hypothetical protein PKI03_14060, partial [Pseudomonadota bacterium]|nr:hypothetical protein [Pseudomonadota bacterium]